MNIRGNVSLFLIICAVAVSPATSQQSPPPSQFGESLEVQLYNLDAVVTDKHGTPVRGLTKEDFTVLEDGVPQEISNFSFYDIGSSTMALAGGAGELVNTPTQTTLAEAPPRRRFVFFIDEMAIQGRARETLKKQAATLLAAMRPGDLATVVRPASTVQFEQKYSSDPAEVAKALNKAIDSCKVRLTAPSFAEFHRFRQALETAESPAEVANAKTIYVEQERTRVEQRIGQVRALIASIAPAEEKKVLVLITSGLNAQPGREVYSTDEQLTITEMHQSKDQAAIIQDMRGSFGDPDDIQNTMRFRALANGTLAMRQSNQLTGWDATYRPGINDLKSQIDDLGRTAAANRIVIYSLTPEIPLFLETGRGADARSKPNVSTLMGDGVHLSAREVVPQEMLNQLLMYEGETLQSFAEKTGGRWFRGDAVIDDTFRAVNDDLQVYYSIAYRGRGNSNKPRKIALKVKGRPELNVRTRSEVTNNTGGDMASRVIAGLLYPMQTDELKMTVNTEAPQKDGKKFNVPLEVVIPTEKITFLLASDGTYQARVIVHYAAAAEKEFISYGRQEQVIQLTPSQYRQVLRIRYRYTSSITVPKGQIRIALGVVDSTSKMSSLQTVKVIAQ
jgi:VWFA-related protein